MDRGVGDTIDETVAKLIREAVAEDLGDGDLTTEAIFRDRSQASAELCAKEDLVLAGFGVATEVFRTVDPALQVTPLAREGDRVSDRGMIARVRGAAASILKAERVALNFLQHLSGVATMTAAFVSNVSDLPVKILDTRKTLPGFRSLEKYAVRVGGGENHRMGLYDAILIKDNHIAAAGGIGQAVKRVRERFPEIKPIEVEVACLEEVRQVLEADADIIMLDNMDLETMRAAVELIGGRAQVEASGNIDLNNVRDVALTGVDRISVGALTHSVRAVDISLKITL